MRRNDIRRVSIMNFDEPTKGTGWENIDNYNHYVEALNYPFIYKLHICSEYRAICVSLIKQFKNKVTVDRLVILKHKTK